VIAFGQGSTEVGVQMSQVAGGSEAFSLALQEMNQHGVTMHFVNDRIVHFSLAQRGLLTVDGMPSFFLSRPNSAAWLSAIL